MYNYCFSNTTLSKNQISRMKICVFLVLKYFSMPLSILASVSWDFLIFQQKYQREGAWKEVKFIFYALLVYATQTPIVTNQNQNVYQIRKEIISLLPLSTPHTVTQFGIHLIRISIMKFNLKLWALTKFSLGSHVCSLQVQPNQITRWYNSLCAILIIQKSHALIFGPSTS